MSTPMAWIGFLISCSLLWISSITLSLKKKKSDKMRFKLKRAPFPPLLILSGRECI